MHANSTCLRPCNHPCACQWGHPCTIPLHYMRLSRRSRLGSGPIFNLRCVASNWSKRNLWSMIRY